MAVFRVEKNKGYTVMSNHHLRNKELSLKAKGLLRKFLSFMPLFPSTKKKPFCRTYTKEKRCNLKKDYNASENPYSILPDVFIVLFFDF